MTRTELPHVGRPSKSGLSEKMLGSNRYQVEMRKRRNLATIGRPYVRFWTGLSAKQLGHTVYTALWREMRKENGRP